MWERDLAELSGKETRRVMIRYKGLMTVVSKAFCQRNEDRAAAELYIPQRGASANPCCLHPGWATRLREESVPVVTVWMFTCTHGHSIINVSLFVHSLFSSDFGDPHIPPAGAISLS